MAKQIKAGPFSKILIDGYARNKFGENTIASTKWLRRKAQELGGSVKKAQFLGDERRTSRLRIGSMFFMNYDPKHKKTLPYYDRYPLFILVDYTKDGFFGLNLHYLPIRQRAILMDALYSYLTDTKFNANTRLQISYGLLKEASGAAGYKPCFKRYLASHIRQGPVFIHPVEWTLSFSIPLARFVKASQAKVYADSRKIMQGI